MDDLTLKPCPFCGSEAELAERKLPPILPVIRYGVTCIECNCWCDYRAETKEKAVALWNRRHYSTPDSSRGPCDCAVDPTCRLYHHDRSHEAHPAAATLLRDLIYQVCTAAVLKAGWPDDEARPNQAVIDRRDEIAEYIAGYALEIEPPPELTKLLAMLPQTNPSSTEAGDTARLYAWQIEVYDPEADDWRAAGIPIPVERPDWLEGHLADHVRFTKRPVRVVELLRRLLSAPDTARTPEVSDG